MKTKTNTGGLKTFVHSKSNPQLTYDESKGIDEAYERHYKRKRRNNIIKIVVILFIIFFIIGYIL